MQIAPDGVLHHLALAQHLMVPEAHHVEAVRRQPRIALRVLRAAMVLAAIGLDDQPFLETDEIDDVTPQRGLPAELEAGEPLGAKHAPQHALRIGRRAAHGFGELAETVGG
jgi:hypothetical protein